MPNFTRLMVEVQLNPADKLGELHDETPVCVSAGRGRRKKFIAFWNQVGMDVSVATASDSVF
jgi:hypothetical protein